MSKPLYWLVWVNGKCHRFNQRAAARAYAAIQKALGHQVRLQPVGFEE